MAAVFPRLLLLLLLLTWLPAWNFFSVPTTTPDRCAALSALLPRTTVSRCEAPPRVRLPILVTSSQSRLADIFAACVAVGVAGRKRKSIAGFSSLDASCRVRFAAERGRALALKYAVCTLATSCVWNSRAK